jgi:hypothetical protein
MRHALFVFCCAAFLLSPSVRATPADDFTVRGYKIGQLKIREIHLKE